MKGMKLKMLNAYGRFHYFFSLTCFFFLLEIMAIRSHNTITGEVADQAATELQTENRLCSDLKNKVHGKTLYKLCSLYIYII